MKFRQIFMHLFNFGIDSGQKLLQHETSCGLPSSCRPAGKRQPLELGRADYTRQTKEDSPLRVVLFPSVPSPPVGLSSRSFIRSVGRPLSLSLSPLAHSLPFPSSNSCRSARRPLSGREQAISSACQVGITRSRAAVKNRAFIHVPNCQAQKSRLTEPPLPPPPKHPE